MKKEDLPIEYTPLTLESLPIGKRFGPVTFSVGQSSHDKTIAMLEKSRLDPGSRIQTAHLMPSEIWGLPRVLSNVYGRVNEAAGVGSSWTILGSVNPGDQMTSIVSAVRNGKEEGLEYVTLEGETRNADGEIVLMNRDRILLFHNAPEGFYHEVERSPSPAKAQRTHRVYFRHEWDPELWQNNIHTDRYAKRFGYERGLPEFVNYMDWIFWALLDEHGPRVHSASRIDVRSILPMYEGEEIGLSIETPRDGNARVKFLRDQRERLLAKVFA